MTQTFFADDPVEEEALLNIPNIMLRFDLAFILDNLVSTLPIFVAAGVKAVQRVAQTTAKTIT